MHTKEAKWQKVGTGRIASLFLKNSEIIIGENFSNNLKVNGFINSPNYYPVILYPGEKSHNITNGPIPIDQNKKLLVFIIDGTWPCSKSMMRDSINLQKLPRISFEVSEISKFKIKHQPANYCLSTIESIFYLLNDLEKFGLEQINGKQKNLMEGLKKIVEFQIKCTNDPNPKGYRRGKFGDPPQRKDSVKWLSRKICFDEKNYLNQIKSSL
jgi:DTW domain-containing protein YfiP